MIRHRLSIGETYATLLVDGSQYVQLAEEGIRRCRDAIVSYGREHPEFLWSLQPVAVQRGCVPLISRMAAAGTLFGVGPMASVAGAIAQAVAVQLVANGAQHVVLDNGGDIAMYLSEPVTVGLYAGPSQNLQYGFHIEETGRFIGLCTSSLTVGHSLSLGLTDASTVYATDAITADAAATALGNSVHHLSSEAIVTSLKQIMDSSIIGAMVVAGDNVGRIGRLPRIVPARVEPSRISCGQELIT